LGLVAEILTDLKIPQSVNRPLARRLLDRGKITSPRESSLSRGGGQQVGSDIGGDRRDLRCEIS
jgi:hypothetical protein